MKCIAFDFFPIIECILQQDSISFPLFKLTHTWATLVNIHLLRTKDRTAGTRGNHTKVHTLQDTAGQYVSAHLGQTAHKHDSTYKQSKRVDSITDNLSVMTVFNFHNCLMEEGERLIDDNASKN